jgi:hypothetical protein
VPVQGLEDGGDASCQKRHADKEGCFLISSRETVYDLYDHKSEGNGSGDLKGVLKAQEDAGREGNLVIYSINEVRWLSSGWHGIPTVIHTNHLSIKLFKLSFMFRYLPIQKDPSAPLIFLHAYSCFVSRKYPLSGLDKSPGVQRVRHATRASSSSSL